VISTIPEIYGYFNIDYAVGMTSLDHVTQRTDLQEFTKDGRMPLQDLYRAYIALSEQHGWSMDVIAEQQAELPSKDKLALPVITLTTPQAGTALWLLAGVHGEEPAGPNAIARSIAKIAALAEKQIPIVLIPLLNPNGYRRNWRYPNEYRDMERGISVTDSDHFLPRQDTPQSPRRPQPASPLAGQVTQHIIGLTRRYPPRLVLDFHEDEDLDHPYIYSQGKLKEHDPVARGVVNILAAHGMALQRQGVTRFGEPVVDGVVYTEQDGSIDELLAAGRVIIDGNAVAGPAAATVVVVETPTLHAPLERRVNAHTAIIETLPEFWETAL
jgi:predicted deacylase